MFVFDTVKVNAGRTLRFSEMSENASARLDRALEQREPHDE